MRSMLYSMSVVALALASSGCHLFERKEPRVEYVPGHMTVEPLKQGDEAPFDGYLIPPSVMAEIGPSLAEALEAEDDNTQDEWREPIEIEPAPLEAPEPEDPFPPVNYFPEARTTVPPLPPTTRRLRE